MLGEWSIIDGMIKVNRVEYLIDEGSGCGRVKVEYEEGVGDGMVVKSRVLDYDLVESKETGGKHE